MMGFPLGQIPANLIVRSLESGNIIRVTDDVGVQGVIIDHRFDSSGDLLLTALMLGEQTCVLINHSTTWFDMI